MRSWRLAAVVADTWKGFSNLAGLSSTVTFVTVTHAISSPSPQQLRIKHGGRLRYKGGRRSKAVLARAHAGVGGAEKENAWSCIRAHVCAVPRTCESWGPSRCVEAHENAGGGARAPPRREGRQLLPGSLLLPARSSSSSILFTRTSRVFFRVKRTAHRNLTNVWTLLGTVFGDIPYI